MSITSLTSHIKLSVWDSTVTIVWLIINEFLRCLLTSRPLFLLLGTVIYGIFLTAVDLVDVSKVIVLALLFFVMQGKNVRYFC